MEQSRVEEGTKDQSNARRISESREDKGKGIIRYDKVLTREDKIKWSIIQQDREGDSTIGLDK